METPAIDKVITLVREKAPRLEILWPSLASAAALGDICLWRSDPRFSIGIFALGLMGLILLNRPGMRWTATTAILAALTCGAAVEAAIDLCFSNVLVMLALVLAVSGETYYDSLRSGWSRWSEAIWTMAKTPGRWCALLLNMGVRLREDGTPDAKGLKRAARAVWIVLPGLAATFVFALIFANGNVLFAHLTSNWFTSIYNWITHFDLSPWRIVFWGFVIVMTLPLLWPSPSPKNPRFWAKEPPRLPDLGTGNTAKLQSGLMLGLLNALFFFVNTLDAVYLWAGQKLPQGVDPKTFVHEGTASIIVAVIFSAILITGIFHQSDRIAKWMPIRLMGMMWIAQNLVLLGGVFLRTKLYIDGYDLTVTRVHLILFFLLVTLGFVLLAIHLSPVRMPAQHQPHALIVDLLHIIGIVREQDHRILLRRPSQRRRQILHPAPIVIHATHPQLLPARLDPAPAVRQFRDPRLPQRCAHKRLRIIVVIVIPQHRVHPQRRTQPPQFAHAWRDVFHPAMRVIPTEQDQICSQPVRHIHRMRDVRQRCVRPMVKIREKRHTLPLERPRQISHH